MGLDKDGSWWGDRSSAPSLMLYRVGEARRGLSASGHRLPWGMMKCPTIRLWCCLHNSTNTLKTTELYTLNG